MKGLEATLDIFFNTLHCVNGVRIWSYSGPDFSAFSRIRTDVSVFSPNLPIFSPNAGKCEKKYGPE